MPFGLHGRLFEPLMTKENDHFGVEDAIADQQLTDLAYTILHENVLPTNIKGVAQTISRAIDVVEKNDLRMRAAIWLLYSLIHDTQIGTLDMHQEWNVLKELAEDPQIAYYWH